MEVSNTKILSDFEDCYDKYLISRTNSLVLDRQDKKINRNSIFKFMRDSGILTMDTKPVFKQEPSSEIVVYDGSIALKMKAHNAMTMYRNNISTEFIQYEKPTSFRRVQIGNYKFILKYTNDNGWRSRGDGVRVTLVDYCEQGINEHIDLPLYYIEYIVHNRQYKAIDMGLNQMIDGTGIDKIIPPKEIANILALASLRKEDKEVKTIWE